MTTMRPIFHVTQNCFHMHILRTDENSHEHLDMHQKIIESFASSREAEEFILGMLIIDFQEEDTGSYSIVKEYTNRQFDDPATDAIVFETELEEDE